MTHKIVLAFAAAASLMLFAPAAHAVTVGITITVDENGNGSSTSSTGTTPLTGAVAGGVLFYDIGLFTVTAGDVLITEPPGGALGDLIRFLPNDAILAFFSVTGGGSLADTGLPSVLGSNQVTIGEGPNGIATYTPSSGQPGFLFGEVITYNFVSDTPLPAALPLFATGIGGLGLLGWRRKRKAQAVA